MTLNSKVISERVIARHFAVWEFLLNFAVNIRE